MKTPLPLAANSMVQSGDFEKLNAEDKAYRQSREGTIRAKQRDFLEIARALRELRDYKGGILYREHGSFQRYCRQLFQINRSYGYAILDAEETYRDLSAQADTQTYTGALPENEKQLRQLKKVPRRDLLLKAWEKSVKASKGGVVHSATIAKQIRQLSIQMGLRLPGSPAHKIESRLFDCAVIVTKEKVAAADIDGNLGWLLKPNGVVYLYLGNAGIDKGIEIFKRWKLRLICTIVLISPERIPQLDSDTVQFGPVLLGAAKPVPVPQPNLLMKTEIPDWFIRLPPKLAAFIDDTTPGPRTIRPLTDFIVRKKLEPEKSTSPHQLIDPHGALFWAGTSLNQN